MIGERGTRLPWQVSLPGKQRRRHSSVPCLLQPHAPAAARSRCPMRFWQRASRILRRTERRGAHRRRRACRASRLCVARACRRRPRRQPCATPPGGRSAASTAPAPRRLWRTTSSTRVAHLAAMPPCVPDPSTAGAARCSRRRSASPSLPGRRRLVPQAQCGDARLDARTPASTSCCAGPTRATAGSRSCAPSSAYDGRAPTAARSKRFRPRSCAAWRALACPVFRIVVPTSVRCRCTAGTRCSSAPQNNSLSAWGHPSVTREPAPRHRDADCPCTCASGRACVARWALRTQAPSTRCCCAPTSARRSCWTGAVATSHMASPRSKLRRCATVAGAHVRRAGGGLSAAAQVIPRTRAARRQAGCCASQVPLSGASSRPSCPTRESHTTFSWRRARSSRCPGDSRSTARSQHSSIVPSSSELAPFRATMLSQRTRASAPPNAPRGR